MPDELLAARSRTQQRLREHLAGSMNIGSRVQFDVGINTWLKSINTTKRLVTQDQVRLADFVAKAI